MIDRSKLPNSFEFVVTAGARARQLLAGSTPRVDGRRAQEDHRRAAGSRHEGGREDRDRAESSNRSDRAIGSTSADRRVQWPMLIALGVTGGIGAYKAVEVARGLQKRGHEVVAVMTRVGDAVRRRRSRSRRSRAAGHHRSVRAGRERRHRAHRARVDDRSAARRAGHRQHHRQVRQRHRRRFPVDAVHWRRGRRC